MSATLEAACKSMRLDLGERVEVKVRSQPCERPFLDVSTIYHTALKDGPHASCVTSQGTILRFRQDPDSGGLYFQRITDPGNVGQWVSWTIIGSAGLPGYVAMAWGDYYQEAYRVYIGTGGTGSAVLFSYSGDDGVTWSAWQTVTTLPAGAEPMGVALCAAAGFVYCGVAGGTPGQADCFVDLWSWGGQDWYCEATTGPDLEPIRGLGMALTDELRFSILTSEGGKIVYREFDVLYVTLYEGWPIMAADPPMTFSYPRLFWFPEERRYCVTFVEDCPAPDFTRPSVSFTPVPSVVTEEVSWLWETAFGLDVYRSADYWYFVTCGGGWRAPIRREELTLPDERIASIDVDERATGGGSLTIRVDNSGGWYNSVPAVLRPGAQVAVKLGYQTSEGFEGHWRQPFWITRVGFQHDWWRGECYLTIEARDTRAELEALRVKRAVEYRGLTPLELLERIWWRVCSRTDHPAGGLIMVLPSFAFVTGQSWREPLNRLLYSFGRVLRFTNGSPDGLGWEAARPELLEVYADRIDWHLGDGGQPIREGGYWRGHPDDTAVEVHGLAPAEPVAVGIAAEGGDWGDLTRPVWRDTRRVGADVKLDELVKVQEVAGLESRWLYVDQAGGEVRVAPVPGLEVGDLVHVTDARAGLESAKRLVWRLRTRLERRVSAQHRRTGYEQVVTLAGVQWVED